MTTLPTHPRTGLTALGYRRDGRPIFPILGGSEDADTADTTAKPDATTTATAQPDKGFPENTPVAEMTTEQAANYWKHQARKHEDRVKAFGGLTPEQLADLRAKAQRAESLERDLMSDSERAVAEAAEQARLVAEAELWPRLVDAELRAAAAAAGKDLGKLQANLKLVDRSKFLTDSGDIDTDMVTEYVDGIAPATGTRRGPSPEGHGRRDSTASPDRSVAAGRELYRNRHAKQTT